MKSFATFLLTVPLTAVGMMAIFGIPQFAPAVDGNPAEDLIRGQFQNPFLQGQTPTNAPAFGSWGQAAPQEQEQHMDTASAPSWPGQHSQHSFANTPAQSPQNLQQQPPAHIQPVAHSTPAEIPWGQAQPVNAGNAMPRPEFSNTSLATTVAPASQPPAQQFSWRDASLKLNELGIKDYHLERGHADGAFLFVCLFSPGDAPHVTHRFEAEAADPLVAVSQVLGQIDQWLGQRYAANNSFSPAMGSL